MAFKYSLDHGVFGENSFLKNVSRQEHVSLIHFHAIETSNFDG